MQVSFVEFSTNLPEGPSRSGWLAVCITNVQTGNWSSTVYVYMSTYTVEEFFSFLICPYLFSFLVIEVAGSCVALLCTYQTAW